MAISKRIIENKTDLYVTPVSGNVNVRVNYSTSSDILDSLKEKNYLKIGDFSYHVNGSTPDKVWYQVLLSSGKIGYVRSDVVKSVKLTMTQINKESTEKLMNNIILTDQKIFENILILSKLIQNAKQKGVNTSSYDLKLSSLSRKLAARQESIRENKTWFGNVKLGFKSAWNDFKDAYNSLMSKIFGIGLEPISTTTLIIIGLSIIATGASITAVYYAFKPKYEEGLADFKETEDFISIMKKYNVSDADQSVIKKEASKQINEAYNDGKNAGNWSGIMSIVKPIGLMAGGFWLVTKFLNNNKR